MSKEMSSELRGRHDRMQPPTVETVLAQQVWEISRLA